MTTEQHQETPEPSSQPQPVPAHPTDSSTAATQVGTVFDQLQTGFQSLTRRFNTGDNNNARRPRGANQRLLESSPERIQQLIQALGDPQHPDHAAAVELLVQIGEPALPYLIETLNTGEPWLAAYRAAEALGHIASGRSTDALIRALRHPNSNVRWSAVRSLSTLGDLRAIFGLRRVAQDDVGRTSWGESVASTAQSALDHLRAKSALGQTMELIKTAITAVLMILALVLAFSFLTQLRDELAVIGRTDVPENVVGVIPPALLTPQPSATATPEATPTRQPTPLPTPVAEVLGTALQIANVRLTPSVDDAVIGVIYESDEIRFLARDETGEWFLIQLGETRSLDSYIENPDGSGAGWVSTSLVSTPEGYVPAFDENFTLPTATPGVAGDGAAVPLEDGAAPAEGEGALETSP